MDARLWALQLSGDVDWRSESNPRPATAWFRGSRVNPVSEGRDDAREGPGAVHDRILRCAVPWRVPIDLLDSLLDQLIGAREQQRWDGEAEGLGGLKVDDQLEFRRL